MAVMRRRADSWLNATQILKVAGIDKGKRTKVLEKEILAGEHEKVQGGYGRYQGTWINYQRGREFCRQYGVEELLRALLDYDMGQDGVTLPGQGGADTPTKEQAMAAHRKKMMFNGGAENRPHAHSPNGTFFKNISATAANAVNAIHKARFDSPGPRPGSGNKRPPPPRRQSLMGSQESNYPGSSQQSMHSEGSFGINGQLEPAFGGHTTPYFTNPQRSNQDVQEPPRKRARPSSSQDPFSQGTNGGYDVSMRSMTPTEPNDSFLYQPVSHSHPVVYDAVTGVQPLPQPSTPATIEKQSALISLFLDQSQTDFSNHEAFKRVSGEDLDIPMDGTAHTALHWAATLGRVPLLRALISKGASIYRVNGGGETALIRAAITTNNLDQGTFPELLELLGPTIEMRDGRGRTVLHHIAVSSAVKGRSPACRYYLESLLEFVVRQGSAPNSQQNSFNGAIDSTPQPKPRPIGLARFMSEIVNAVDMSGDTALNLAARIGNKSIIQQLLEVGANPTIPNRGGLKPVDFGVGGDPETSDARPSSQMSLPGHERTTTNRVSDSSRDLMSCKSTSLLPLPPHPHRPLTNPPKSNDHPPLRRRNLLPRRAAMQTSPHRPNPHQAPRNQFPPDGRTTPPRRPPPQQHPPQRTQATNHQPPPRHHRAENPPRPLRHPHHHPPRRQSRRRRRRPRSRPLPAPLPTSLIIIIIITILLPASAAFTATSRLPGHLAADGDLAGEGERVPGEQFGSRGIGVAAPGTE